MYLIQGYFFQNSRAIVPGMGQRGEGVVAVLQEQVISVMFSGVIRQAELNLLGEFTGVMTDVFGCSILSEMICDEDFISFTKQYDGREAPIFYEFRRVGSIWIGKWKGPMVGAGSAKCIVTEVPDDMDQLY